MPWRRRPRPRRAAPSSRRWRAASATARSWCGSTGSTPAGGSRISTPCSVASAKPDAILVPKISDPNQLQDLAARFVDLHTDPHVRVWAMMETPLAMLNAERDRRRGARFRDAARRLRHGHQRSRQGHARAARARPRADAAVADDLRRRRARLRLEHSRRRLQRSRQCRGLRRGVQAGARSRLRRQDADPSAPDRAVQRGILAGAGRSCHWRAR